MSREFEVTKSVFYKREQGREFTVTKWEAGSFSRAKSFTVEADDFEEAYRLTEHEIPDTHLASISCIDDGIKEFWSFDVSSSKRSLKSYRKRYLLDNQYSIYQHTRYPINEFESSLQHENQPIIWLRDHNLKLGSGLLKHFVLEPQEYDYVIVKTPIRRRQVMNYLLDVEIPWNARVRAGDTILSFSKAYVPTELKLMFG